MNEYEQHIQTYIGKSYQPNSLKNTTVNTVTTSVNTVNKKVIVFDLDETIGSFSDLYILWRYIRETKENQPEENQPEENQHQTKETQISDFIQLLDLYPEFLRHGIICILKFINHKRKQGLCKIYLYTNNQCKPEWVSFIVEYINAKLNTDSFFDKVIGSFKINNKRYELSRTTHNKTHCDFLRCSLLPKTTELCFIDNTYHDKMLGNRVFYIQPRSYNHYLSTQIIVNRFSQFYRVDSRLIMDWFLENGAILNPIYTQENLEIDLYVSQRLMHFIKDFFYLSSMPKNTQSSNKKTKRRRVLQPKRTTQNYGTRSRLTNENKKSMAIKILGKIDSDK